MSLMSFLKGLKEGEKPVVFQSRYKSLRVILKQKVNGKDDRGRSLYENVKAVFHNGLLVVVDNEENKDYIALLRANIGKDYFEVDYRSKVKTEEATEKELNALRKRVKDLEALQAQTVGKPKVKRQPKGD